MHGVFHIRLIEICYVNRTALVHHTEFNKLHAPADTHKARSVGNKSLDAGDLPVAGQSDGLELAAILIFSWKIRNKVMDGEDAELVQKLRLLLAYALAVSYVSIQICHITSA